MCALDGGCQVPMGAYADIRDDVLTIHGFVGAVDGSIMLRASVSGPASDYEALGCALADKLLAEGARTILETIRNEG